MKAALNTDTSEITWLDEFQRERESEKEQGATNSDSIRTLPAMCKVHSDLQTTLLLKAKPVAGKVTKYRMRYLMWPSDVQEGSCDYTTSNQGDATPLHY